MKMRDFKYIDVHSHPHFSDFDKDREQLFKRMRELGVGTIAIGTCKKTSAEVLELARKYEFIWASIGQHPTERECFDEDFYSRLLKENNDRQIVAIGECGLDYFRMDASEQKEKERQRELFEKQIMLAVEFALPLILHIRSSANTSDAHDDAYEILKRCKEKHPKLHLHMHFFTETSELAKRFLELGASFGIPGVVTFKSAQALHEAVKIIPDDKILLESDAPYAAPAPHRGKRNEPTFVSFTLEKIAELRDEGKETLRRQILENSKNIFSLQTKF